jgi:ankyrin repeat protein
MDRHALLEAAARAQAVGEDGHRGNQRVVEQLRFMNGVLASGTVDRQAVVELCTVAGWTPAIACGLACEADTPHVLSALLDKFQLPVNSADASTSLNLTPLTRAAFHGSTTCVALLLGRGADVNLGCSVRRQQSPERVETYRPLFAAAEVGHVAVCRQLIDAGAMLNDRSLVTECTALHAAAAEGHVGVVALLVQRGADTRVADVQMQTPIMHACLKQQVLVVKVLMPHADLAQVDDRGVCLLHNAAGSGGTAVLEAVLPRYVEVGAVDTPRGVDRSKPNASTGSTPLMHACLHSRYAEAKLLLKAGADRYASTPSGTPLLHCVAGASVACLELLLGTAGNWQFTAEQLNECFKGNSILHLATTSGTAEMCKLLMSAGADPLLPCENGETCLDLARRLWPKRLDLAAVFDPDAASLAPPCCAHCLKTDVKLSACANCQEVRYCSKTCQRQHWQQHKPACVSPRQRMETFKEEQLKAPRLTAS